MVSGNRPPTSSSWPVFYDQTCFGICPQSQPGLRLVTRLMLHHDILEYFAMHLATTLATLLDLKVCFIILQISR